MFRQDCYDIKRLLPGFSAFGCAVCSAAHITEQVTGASFFPLTIREKCKSLQVSGVLDEEFYVNDWVKLFHSFGLIVSVEFRGPEYICKPGEEEILKLVKPGYSHFVAGDGTGHYSFDSLGRRKGQKDYKIFDKRVITIKGRV